MTVEQARVVADMAMMNVAAAAARDRIAVGVEGAEGAARAIAAVPAETAPSFVKKTGTKDLVC